MERKIEKIKPTNKHGLPIGITVMGKRYRIAIKVTRNGKDSVLCASADSIEEALKVRNEIIEANSKYLNRRTLFYIMCEGLYKDFRQMPRFIRKSESAFQVIVSGVYLGTFRKLNKAIRVRDNAIRIMPNLMPKGIRKSSNGYLAILHVPYLNETIRLGTFETVEKAVSVRSMVLKEMMG